MSQKRTYDNTLRKQRAEETREKIKTALSKLIARGSLDDLSVPRLAEMAGVSEPTVYRYYPNREALLDALEEQMQTDFPRPPPPESLDGLPGHIENLFELFEKDRDLIISFFKSQGSRDARKTLRRKRLKFMKKQIDEEFPALEEDERLQIFGVIQLLASGDAWRSMEDFVGLRGREAGEAAAWALRTVIADARRKNARAEREGPSRGRGSVAPRGKKGARK